MAQTKYRLRIHHDHLVEGAEAKLVVERRVIYCVAGDAQLSCGGKTITLSEDEGWSSDQEVTVRGGAEGACLWRWELVALDAAAGEIKKDGIKSANAGDYKIEIDTSIKRLMRLDRVSFPL